MKKVRLIEESIGYEDLALMDNFSDDELTCELQRQILKEKKERMALQHVRKMEEYITEMKAITMRGMLAYINTIHAIDDQSKKMVYKQFVQSNVNILAKEAHSLTLSLINIAESYLEQAKKLKGNRLEL